MAAAQGSGSAGQDKQQPSSDGDEVKFDVDPDTASFSSAGDVSEHMIVNLGETRLAVKVKCSDVNLFRVMPVYTFIEAGQCKNLVITPEAKQDRLVFHYFPCASSATDAQAAFKNVQSGVVRKLTMMLNVHAPEGGTSVTRKTNVVSMKVVDTMSQEPWEQREDKSIAYFPNQPMFHYLTKMLSLHGVFLEEHVLWAQVQDQLRTKEGKLCIHHLALVSVLS
uniref:Major sperm protein n=1 Tax=Ditylenchus dipsaci TaxID=166011 RepID=A0A915CU23_9BILA